jgi:hypothetical protein
MSWYRVDSPMPRHEKYAPLSDLEFRLAITAGAWCAEHMTDGFIPKKMVQTLTRAPSGKKLASAIKSLLDAKVWHDKGDHYELHDFLDWNLSKAQWEARVSAGSAGGKAKAAKRSTEDSVPSSRPPPDDASKRLAHASVLVEHQLEQMQQQTASTCSSTRSTRSPISDLRSSLNPVVVDLTGFPRENAEFTTAATNQKVRCPSDLRLTEDQRGALETSMIPGWAIDELTTQYVSSQLADEDKTMPIVAWRKCLAKSISSAWNDTRRRPRRPELEQQKGDSTTQPGPPPSAGQVWHHDGYWYYPLPEQAAV